MIIYSRFMVDISAKIRPSLIALNVGDEISFPIEKLKSVRTQASELGAIMSRQYTTKTDRINHIIKGKRIL